MFVKLLKYDLKAMARLIVPSYLILVLLALVARGSSILVGMYPDNLVLGFFKGAALVFLAIGIIFILVATVLLSLMRFRGNLLRDEGYLMLTLPVTVTQLFNSKLLASMIFYVLDLVVMYLLGAFALWQWMFSIDLTSSGISAGDWNMFLFLMIGYLIISIVISQIQIFACLGIGYTLKGNRDLMSFGVYIATYVITQVIGIITLAITYFSYPNLMQDIARNVMPLQLIVRLFGLLSLFMVVFGVALEVFTIYRMKNKLNLE